MDFIKELGELAMGSRLRRLSDRMMQDGTKIYEAAHLSFQPRWFTVFALLSSRGATGITDIARDLGISHAAVNQTASELTRAGLIESNVDEKDRRRRLLYLTEQGCDMANRLQPVWEDIRGAIRDVISDAGVDLMGVVEAIEESMSSRGFFDRFHTRLKRRQRDAVEIIPFERGNAGHQRAFFRTE